MEVNTRRVKNTENDGSRCRYLKLEVADSGIGIKRKDLNKIFGLF